MVLSIFKRIAISSFLTALECTKNRCVPDPTGGAYSAPQGPDPLAGLTGPTC